MRTMSRTSEGALEWRNSKGQLHSENDLPAIESRDGSLSWFHNGRAHRENGPAIESYDGSKSWYRNGKLHREDGPATEWSGNRMKWFLNDIEYRIPGYLYEGRTPPEMPLSLFLAYVKWMRDHE